MRDDSTPPQGQEQEAAYAALIKVGDAVETPDGALWIVQQVKADGDILALASATRASESGLVIADVIDVVRTQIPTELARKVADARQVRR